MPCKPITGFGRDSAVNLQDRKDRGRPWVAAQKVSAQLFHPYRCTKSSLCKAVDTNQPSGLIAIFSPSIFAVQLNPVSGLLMNEESHKTHSYSTGTCTGQWCEESAHGEAKEKGLNVFSSGQNRLFQCLGRKLFTVCYETKQCVTLKKFWQFTHHNSG